MSTTERASPEITRAAERYLELDRRVRIALGKHDAFGPHQGNHLVHDQVLKMIELRYCMDVARTRPSEGADRINTAVVHEFGPERGRDICFDYGVQTGSARNDRRPDGADQSVFRRVLPDR
jgi:hypothetical protein